MFRDRIAPELFEPAAPQERPVLVVFGGQPGAGKSQGRRVIESMHIGRDLVPVEGDDFRRFHPEYRRVLDQDPLSMPEVTAPAAGWWTGRAVGAGITGSYSLLVEGTWRDVRVPQRTLGMAREAGYETHAVVVATPAALSLTGTRARYYDDAARARPARWTPLEAHETTVAALPGSVAELAGSALVDRFTIIDRSGAVHLDMDAGDLGARAREAGRVYAGLAGRALTGEEADQVRADLARCLPLHHEATLGDPRALTHWRRVAEAIPQAGLSVDVVVSAGEDPLASQDLDAPSHRARDLAERHRPPDHHHGGPRL